MDKKEQIEKAIEILANHNKWRKGSDIHFMAEPKELGDAIDTVVNALSQPKEEPKKEVDLDRVKYILQEHSVLYLQCFSEKQAADLLQNTLNKLLPHLQKPVESDAVELTTKEINKSCDENIEGVGLIYMEMAAIYKKRMRNAVKLINAKNQFKQLKK
jgi:C-terminal processing protease CtpA/Prc